MSTELFELPEKPFFTCDADGFSILDGARMRNAASILSIEPLFNLRVSPGNVFEERPRKVVKHEGKVVSVECDGASIVVLDFADYLARKQTGQGEFIYRGGLDEGNDGKGWIPAR